MVFDFCFLVGGGSKLSREEREELRAEVDAEFDSEGRQSKKKKNGRNTPKAGGRKSNNEDDFGSLFGEGITGKLPRFANRITFKVCMLLCLCFIVESLKI